MIPGSRSPTKLFAALAPIARANLFGHAGVLNALDLRLNGLEIVTAGPERQKLYEAALALSLSIAARSSISTGPRRCRKPIPPPRKSPPRDPPRPLSARKAAARSPCMMWRRSRHNFARNGPVLKGLGGFARMVAAMLKKQAVRSDLDRDVMAPLVPTIYAAPLHMSSLDTKAVAQAQGEEKRR